MNGNVDEHKHCLHPIESRYGYWRHRGQDYHMLVTKRTHSICCRCGKKLQEDEVDTLQLGHKNDPSPYVHPEERLLGIDTTNQ